MNPGSSRSVQSDAPANIDVILEFCVCPACLGPLELDGGRLTCNTDGNAYGFESGVPVLLPKREADIDRRYFENYETIATDDLAKPIEGNRPARHQKLREFIGSVTGKRILDIGSSDATYLRQLDGDVKVALDIAIAYLAAIPRDSGIVAVCGDAEHLPVRAGYFDVVIISDVLEHVLHPERVVEHLERVCRPDTRLIVHVPWEEDLSKYRNVPYEFAHLRSFNAYNFGLLFKSYYEVRSRGTYPDLDMPLPYRLYGRLPGFLYNTLMMLQRSRFGRYMYTRWEAWIKELPNRERRLLIFYRPVFRQFELRLWSGNLAYRLARRLRRRLRAARS